MAYKLNYENEQGVCPEAYMLIDKIIITKVDQEIFVPRDEGGMKLTYVPKLVYSATVRIYVDELARSNRALPIHTTSFEFEWDGESDLFQAAYQTILDLDEFNQYDLEDC